MQQEGRGGNEETIPLHWTNLKILGAWEQWYSDSPCKTKIYTLITRRLQSYSTLNTKIAIDLILLKTIFGRNLKALCIDRWSRRCRIILFQLNVIFVYTPEAKLLVLSLNKAWFHRTRKLHCRPPLFKGAIIQAKTFHSIYTEHSLHFVKLANNLTFWLPCPTRMIRSPSRTGGKQTKDNRRREIFPYHH